jgi:hypothetical protein
MTVIAERLTSRTAEGGVLVSAPPLKFTIGVVACLCAVLGPRLIAALTVPDRTDITFVTREYFALAVIFSGIVGVVVTILEWHVPRAPRDTFTTTLGIPAILAGALSANQGAATLQQAMQQQNELVRALSIQSNIPIESAKPMGTTGIGGEPGKSGMLRNLVETPAYAEQQQRAVRPQQPPRLGIVVDQARYFIVLDRASTLAGAQKKQGDLNARLQEVAPNRPLSLRIEKQASEFLVIEAGGARVKSDALVEAVRLKDVYRITPTLVEVARQE